MKFSFNFSNLLGTVYKKGDLVFSPDGNSVISPVGNRITVYDLKNNRSNTLAVESSYNFTSMDLSPNGCTLVAANEEGETYMISMVSGTVIHKYRFHKQVSAIKFSPDGKYFAVSKDNNVFIMRAPGPYTGEYNAFVMERVFRGAAEEVTCVEWSSCSRIIAIGSKDMCTRIYALEKYKNFKSYLVGGHSQSIVGCFFEKNSFDLTTVSSNGQVCVWECNIDPDELELGQFVRKKKKIVSESNDEEEEDDVDNDKIIEKDPKKLESAVASYTHMEEDGETRDDKGKVVKNTADEKRFKYSRNARHYLGDLVRKDSPDALLTTVAYHKETKILVTGFSNGSFFLHELPEVNLIHSLKISDYQVSSIAVSRQGDWIALGCSGIGQLLVWEWQSEQYVMKQQGHSSNMTCLSYSPDGQYIATGGHDGKVKLWNTSSGFCFVTFSEHSTSVTGIQFSANKKFFVSSSLDGTVRCYDITRYRNFKTLTSPTPAQFCCVSLDSSGELCAAGAQDVFEIFIWSVKLGKLLEVLSGHEGPVVSLCFSPTLASSALASVSWDKTLRLWNCIESGCDHETVQLVSEGMQVAYRPDGQKVSVCSLDGQITFFDVSTTDQGKIIDGRNDLGSGRSDTDLITAKKSQKAKAFTTLCYSADGQCVLAGGQSKNICIYNVEEGVLLKKFEITQNKSLDAMNDFISRRNMTEFGNLMLIEQRTSLEGGDVAVRLPGVKHGDMADRSFKPEVRVFCVRFSPTGQIFSVATTEGLMQYSLNTGGVFQPYQLQLSATPESVREALKKQEWSEAIMAAVQLNENAILQEVIESIAVKDIELTVSSLPDEYIERLVKTMATLFEDTRHIELYLHWISYTLTKPNSKLRGSFAMPTLLALEKAMARKYQQLGDICDFNKYTLRYLTDVSNELHRGEIPAPMEVDDQSSGLGTGGSDDEDNKMMDAFSEDSPSDISSS